MMNGTLGKTIAFVALAAFALVWHGVPAGASEPVADGERQSNSPPETTVEWVCATYPGRITALLENLDLQRDGLQDVKAAAARGDRSGACEALLEYYRRGSSGKWLRGPAIQPGDGRSALADAMLNDTFTFYLQTSRVPRKPDGGLTWSHRGPSDDREWTLALNRHNHLLQLLGAYRDTGNSGYAVRIDEHLRDWIIASLPYPQRRNVGDMWRGLEVSFRAKAWAEVFYGLQQDARLTPAARLLILTSLPEHADYLRRYHGRNNWITMELSALAMIGAAWPEYRDSGQWLDYAIATLTQEISTQVYADGAQHELASAYHHVALRNFEQLAAICSGAGIQLPEQYVAGLERMWGYLACTIRPDGRGLLNNDSDLVDNRDSVLRAAEAYSHPDWAYVASNGARGSKPGYGPSLMFPWAGQLVVRSGWDADALWAFFDLGPWGTGHQHNDKLHLSVAAHGRDLIVDSGRFTYSGSNARFRRDYAMLSRAHNVILIDGKGQGPGPTIAQQPISADDYAATPALTFARGACDHFAGLDGHATHTRAVVYVADKLIVVADRIDTDRPRHLETLWHWHPHCNVEVDGPAIVSTDAGAGNLRIAPVAGLEWATKLVKGQLTPHLQGWYSSQYNEWEASSTAVLTSDIEGSSAFAWLLLPSRGEVPHIRGDILENTAEAIRVQISIPGERTLFVRIPWQHGAPQVGRE